MKATGVVRRIDTMGRFVIPKEIRDISNVDVGDALEVFVEDDKIILKRFTKACSHCGNREQEELIKLGYEYICLDCIHDIKNKFGGKENV